MKRVKKQKMDRHEAAYRKRRFDEVTAMLDKWAIREVNSNGSPAFIAHPLWDDEWLMSRNSYPTRAEALAEMRRNDGVLLNPADAEEQPEPEPTDNEKLATKARHALDGNTISPRMIRSLIEAVEAAG